MESLVNNYTVLGVWVILVGVLFWWVGVVTTTTYTKTYEVWVGEILTYNTVAFKQAFLNRSVQYNRKLTNKEIMVETRRFLKEGVLPARAETLPRVYESS